METTACSDKGLMQEAQWAASISIFWPSMNILSGAAGISMLGPIEEKFVEVTDVMEPLESGQRDKCFVSKGYDATSHFETTVEDVLELYSRITGKVGFLDCVLSNACSVQCPRGWPCGLLHHLVMLEALRSL